MLRDSRGLQTALDEFARLIAQTALNAMPPDLLTTLETEEGMAAFRRPGQTSRTLFCFGGTRDGCASSYAAGNQQGREAAATGSGELAAGFAIESRG